MKMNLIRNSSAIKKLKINISKAKDGDQLALKYLLDTHWKEVYSYLLKRVKSKDDAEDITIQTFSKAFDKIDTYNENYTFKTWLIAISKNIHIDITRKKKNYVYNEFSIEDKVYLVADESPTPEDKIIKEQNLASLLINIKELKYKYQEVIHLRYFKELSYKEISSKINEPMNNVKVKLLRAKKLLSEIIKKVDS